MSTVQNHRLVITDFLARARDMFGDKQVIDHVDGTETLRYDYRTYADRVALAGFGACRGRVRRVIGLERLPGIITGTWSCTWRSHWPGRFCTPSTFGSNPTRSTTSSTTPTTR